MISGGTFEPGWTGVVVLVLLGVLAAGLLWWGKRRVGSTGDGPIRLVSIRSLGGKRLLALVEVEQERFLLGMTDERIACLGRLEARRETSRLRSVGELT